jgi:hypothetical protein
VLRTWLGPLRLDWVAEHTEYDPPHSFADRQVKGPFVSWNHRHQFREDGSGGTWLRDEVEYEPPLGVLGRWLGGGFLNRKLQRLFDYRHEMTRGIVERGDFSCSSTPAPPGRVAAGNTPTEAEDSKACIG